MRIPPRVKPVPYEEAFGDFFEGVDLSGIPCAAGVERSLSWRVRGGWLTLSLPLLAKARWRFVAAAGLAMPLGASGGGSAWLAALAFWAAMLGEEVSVLLHELGHVLGARLVGHPIRGVFVGTIGGFVWHEPMTDPRRSLKIALGGPIVTLLLAVSSSIALGLLLRAGALLAVPLAASLSGGNLVLLRRCMGPARNGDADQIARCLMEIHEERLRRYAGSMLSLFSPARDGERWPSPWR